MTNRFEFTDPDGDKLVAYPSQRMDEVPAVSLYAEQGHESTNVHIPLSQLEEFIAGLREIARQQSDGQAAADQPTNAQPVGTLPQLLATRLTERFTALGNPFSRMSINFQGPDGWPASRDVSPNDVADVLRELLGQAGAQPAPGRRRLTELEHDAAWHAIEGTAGEPGADPGTVLAAVLRALDIDPPADQTLLTPPSEQRAQLLGEISVPIEEALRAAGHPAAADRIVGIICDLARRASQTTQHAFALTSGGPGPSAAEGAGA
ncbi:hypothetical protein [Streptomyces lavendulae]|uniref:hypothetical protein n=1 Tax=Streptomyces lavendulae TaxID=1914 RepID=UPI0036ED9B4F